MKTIEIIRNSVMQCIERIAKLSKIVTMLKTDVGTLKTDVGTLKTDVGTLKTDLGTLKTDLGTLKEDLIPLNTFMNATLFRELGCVLKNKVSGNMTTFKDGVVDKPNVADYILAGCAKSYKCKSSTTNVVFKNFDTSQITDMNFMFVGCSSLTSLDLSSFDTSAVTYMYDMFYGCSSLTSLDLSSFDTSSVTDMSYIFKHCSSLASIIGTHTLEEVQAGAVKTLRGLKEYISFSDSPNLERASILALFYGLADLTGKTKQTISLHSTAKARLTAEDIKIATDKNWNVQ